MDKREAQRLNLLDLEAELADRLFHLCNGLPNSVTVSPAQRRQVVADVHHLQPRFESARSEFESLRQRLQRVHQQLSNLATDSDQQTG